MLSVPCVFGRRVDLPAISRCCRVQYGFPTLKIWTSLFRRHTSTSRHAQQDGKEGDANTTRKSGKQGKKRQPVFTPSIIQATLYHPPLARLKPQPLKTSMMIKKRIRMRQNWIEEMHRNAEALLDIDRERLFLRNLAVTDEGREWDAWRELKRF